jgi:radical SAM protein (TIGR01212 family)
VSEQFAVTRARLGTKWSTERCIPYFQAHTGTYAPVEVLRPLYEEALAQEGVVAMHVATRADCLPDEVLELLCEVAAKTHLVVELGLQTVHDRTAERINRGHTFAAFREGLARLRAAAAAAGVQIDVCIHLIHGLPGESDEDVLETVREVAALRPEQVKIHLLHVLRGTPLAAWYESGAYVPLTEDRYVDLVVRSLELLPADTVIARLTGDGMGEDLLAPDWSRKKVAVLDAIDRVLFERNTWQGKAAEGAGDAAREPSFKKVP